MLQLNAKGHSTLPLLVTYLIFSPSEAVGEDNREAQQQQPRSNKAKE